MILIFSVSEHDLDAISIAKILKFYGLKSKIVLTLDEKSSNSEDINILTNDFVLQREFKFEKYTDIPTFVNAYTKDSIYKIGLEPKKAGEFKELEYVGEEYFAYLLIDKPEYFFKADDSLVKNGIFSAVGQKDGIGISTIPIGQFLNLLNGWSIREKKIGRLYPKINKLPLNYIKKTVLPVYNVLRRPAKKNVTNGFDLALLLRESFIKSLELIAGKSFTTKKGKTPVILTHDIDVPESLRGIKSLLEIEGTFNFPSSWYINKNAMSNFKEIYKIGSNCFSHHLNHDGSLAYLPYDKLLDSLKTNNLNNGFRAPWLHHNTKLFKALNDAGYIHDSSMPSYEDFTPFYRPGGCLDIIPFNPILPSLEECDFLEIPVTLTQDYGLFNVYNLDPQASFEIQRDRIEYIIKHNGVVNIVTHPDLKDCGSKEGQKFYYKLLEYIDNSKELEVLEVNDLIRRYTNL